MDEQLNIIKNQTEQCIDNIFKYISNNNKIENICNQVNILNEKLDKIILQNEEILQQYKALTERFNKEPLYVNDSTKELNESKKEIHKTSINSDETYVNKDVSKKTEIDNNQHSTVIETTQNNIDTTIQNNISQSEQSQKKETSSVLEFLHQRVIKDNSQERKGDSLLDRVNNKKDYSEANNQQQTDLFSDNRPKSIAEQFENKTNSDLKTAIGVNERFVFINDLFSGNTTDYTNFIENLNNINVKDEALNVLQTYQQQKKWAKGSLAYTTLESLIIKRFE